MNTPENSHRRCFIGRMLALCAWPSIAARAADVPSESAETMIVKLTGGKIVNEGRVKLELPLLADNGNSVSLKVSVDSPMTPAELCQKHPSVTGLRNPRPNIANFYLGPRAGRAQVSTRVRLGGANA